MDVDTCGLILSGSNHPSEKNDSSMSEWVNGSQMNEYALLLLGWYHGTTELAVELGFRSWFCELLSKITHLNRRNIFWTHTKKQVIEIHFGGLFIIFLCIYVSICRSTYVCTHTMPPSWGKWRQYHHDRLIMIGKMRNWCNNVNTCGTCSFGFPPSPRGLHSGHCHMYRVF